MCASGSLVNISVGHNSIVKWVLDRLKCSVVLPKMALSWEKLEIQFLVDEHTSKMIWELDIIEIRTVGSGRFK